MSPDRESDREREAARESHGHHHHPHHDHLEVSIVGLDRLFEVNRKLDKILENQAAFQAAQTALVAKVNQMGIALDNLTANVAAHGLAIERVTVEVAKLREGTNEVEVQAQADIVAGHTAQLDALVGSTDPVPPEVFLSMARRRQSQGSRQPSYGGQGQYGGGSQARFDPYTGQRLY